MANDLKRRAGRGHLCPERGQRGTGGDREKPCAGGMSQQWPATHPHLPLNPKRKWIYMTQLWILAWILRIESKCNAPTHRNWLKQQYPLPQMRVRWGQTGVLFVLSCRRLPIFSLAKSWLTKKLVEISEYESHSRDLRAPRGGGYYSNSWSKPGGGPPFWVLSRGLSKRNFITPPSNIKLGFIFGRHSWPQGCGGWSYAFTLFFSVVFFCRFVLLHADFGTKNNSLFACCFR